MTLDFNDENFWQSMRVIEDSDQAMAEEMSKLYYRYPPREPGWVDARQMSREWKCHPTTAKERLDNLVNKGLAERKQVQGERGPINVYRKKQETQ